MLGVKDYRGMSYIGEKFERKQLRHFSQIRSRLKIPDFLHIAPTFCMQSKGQLKPTLNVWIEITDLLASNFTVS